MPTVTYNATKDASVAIGTGWNGYDYHLSVGGVREYMQGGNARQEWFRSFVYFPINFTSMKSITSATLRLNCSMSNAHVSPQSANTTDMLLTRMTADWGEGTNLGENYSLTEAWNWTNRASAAAEPNLQRAVTMSSGGWIELDVTAMVAAWAPTSIGGSGYPNYGMRLASVNESDDAHYKEFFSRQWGDGPQLVITYVEHTAPNAPTGLYPTGDVTMASANPTLQGNHSDADGDAMAGVHIAVWDSAGVNQYWDSGEIAASGNGFSITYSGSPLSPNVVYHWWARTKDVNGYWGPWAGPHSFRVNGVPYAPALGGPSGEIYTLSPIFYVTHQDPNPSDRMTRMVIEVQRADGSLVWNSDHIHLGGSYTTAYTGYAGPPLSWGTQYRWRATTMDEFGAWGPWSDYQYFNTHATAPAVNLYPSNVTVNSLVPTFSGTRANDSDTFTGAELQVYDATGSTLIWSISFTPGSTSFSQVYGGTTLAYATTYTWRIRLTGNIGGQSQWTSLQAFTTPAATAITQSAPIGTGITDLTPDLTFARSDAFNAYDIEVRRVSDNALMWSTGTVLIGSSVTSRAITYAGTALSWNTAYKWRVRVSSDGGSTWGNGFSGYQNFTTDNAGAPTLTAPIDGAWLSTLTPTFTGTTYNSEVISTFQILLYASDGTTLVWDSGQLAGSGTSFSKVYNGPALSKGTVYIWKAMYVKNTGPSGPYSTPRSFHTNADPSAPTGLRPANGAVVEDTLTPVLKATYVDADKTLYADYPTQLDFEVYRNSDSVLMWATSVTSGLTAGENSVTYAGTALVYETEYKVRARYTDSLGAVGAWSSFNVFKPSQSPSVTIDEPSTSTIGSPSFLIDWTFTSPGGKSQREYRLWLERMSDEVKLYDTGIVVSGATQFTFPAGYLVNSTLYRISLQAWDSDGLDTTRAVKNVTSAWLAPDAITGFSGTIDEDRSRIILEWDASQHEEFSYYTVYRRERGGKWEPLARITNQNTRHYYDYRVAQGIKTEYKVTQTRTVTGDIDIESGPSDIYTGTLETDIWMFVGGDRSPDHIFELPVTDEDHIDVIQQETFEPLGTNRKTISRGSVLGEEGVLVLLWASDERTAARGYIRYLVENKGPHVLKSPFGDVWEVEFTGPSKKYQMGGGLGVRVTWTEVA